MASDWTTLDELPAGTLFETREGAVALKTEYNDERIINGRRWWLEPHCFLLETGDRLDLMGANPAEIDVRALNHTVFKAIGSEARSGAPSLLNHPCTLAVTLGSSRFGTVVSQDERGLWFRGKMERDNPKERERTYFVPWTSVVWMEMEEE